MVETLVPTICAQYFGTKSIHNLDSKFWVNFEDLNVTNCTASLTLRFAPPFGEDNYYDLHIKPQKHNKLYHPVK